MIDLDKIEDKSDHDLLIVAVTSLAALETNFTNHLAHHEADAAHRRNRELVYLSVGLGSIITALFAVLTLFSS